MLNNFSPNMLKTYKNCPKQFYYRYIENLSVPQSSVPFEKGKKIHALANYFMQGVKIDRLESALNNQERKIWNLLLQNSYFNKDCFKSEFNLSIKISDYWIGGRIDAIVHDYDKYYILDYKTGSAPQNPQYDLQTMIYMLCADKYIKTYDSLSFVYIDLKNNTNIITDFNAQLKSEYFTYINNLCKRVNSDKLFKCNHENCKNCEYSKFCY